MLHTQRLYETHEIVTERKMMNSVVVIRGEIDEDNDTWVGKVLSLFCCVVGRNKVCTGMAFV